MTSEWSVNETKDGHLSIVDFLLLFESQRGTERWALTALQSPKYSFKGSTIMDSIILRRFFNTDFALSSKLFYRWVVVQHTHVIWPEFCFGTLLKRIWAYFRFEWSRKQKHHLTHSTMWYIFKIHFFSLFFSLWANFQFRLSSVQKKIDNEG